jgi:exodeoxyribonuclease V beta subunit
VTATIAPTRTDFALCGPLPSGTTILEASAGTGKTYTIASLAARYLAEGEVELSQLLLVTFGRMATNELRLRVRSRLVSVEAALAAALVGTGGDPADPLVSLLTDVPREEIGRRRQRVARALADFDAATIATTHEFCLQMLDGLGVLGDREPQAVFVEHVTDLTREIATDLYLRRYATWESPPMSYPEAVQIAQQAVAAGHARLVPTADNAESGDHSTAAERVAYAEAARAEVAARMRSGRLFTYDDMLIRLRDALKDPDRGPAAADRLRERYRVVMVDEFQDTDPVQWEILRRAFVGRSTLILIGDPKQAIYAFRGADVYSYLDAVATADRVQTLPTNWRSDAALLDGLDALMGGAALGEPEIVVRPVRADHEERRLSSAHAPQTAVPVRIRVVPHPPDADRVASVSTHRPRITDDLVADVTAALASDLHLNLDGERRRVRPADIAVLVRTNSRGEAIRDALVAAKVPAVLLGSGSVFASAVAEDWLTLLVALEQPRSATVRQAALTCFVGWTFAELAAADEAQLSDLTQRVRRWSRVLAARGVAALVEMISTDLRLVERLLAHSGGERRLTDLRHLGQSLHAAMVSGQLGVSALVEWLRARMAEARASTAPDGTQRLETDARAVRVLTVHRSKGLEFPLVYLPDAWDRHVGPADEGAILRLHDRPAGSDPFERGEYALDVGGRWGPGRNDRWRRSQAEDAGEDLRLFYVAATRAQCQLITWWAPSHNTPASALQRLLYRPTDAEVSLPAPAYDLEGDPFNARDLGPQIALEILADRGPTDWQPPRPELGALTARDFDRVLDTEWRRTSYSGLTAAAHGGETAVAGVASEAEPAREDDEAATAAGPDGRGGFVAGAVPADTDLALVSPMAELPMGAEFGVAVHAVLEAVDPQAQDLPTELRRACDAVLARLPVGSFSAEELAAGLAPAFATPLGPLAGGRTLADIPRRDRLAELGFELPLAGGEVIRAEVSLADLVPLLREHLPPGDPLARYPDALADPVLGEQTLRGFLTGSVDAVLRVPGADGDPRYLVVDYKTNWLGPLDGPPLTVGRYTQPRMAEAMVGAHYPLQALLYAVAVHRLLRWRQPGYDPDRHLGGVLYLFVRGMAGPATPAVDGVPCGVFSWRPPGALVTALSDRLDGDPA